MQKKKQKPQAKMWQGRFSKSMAESMERLSFSLHFDKKLYQQDIAGSLAHAEGLHIAGVLNAAELKKMRSGLEGILADLNTHKPLFLDSDEDIHMGIERVLTERIGNLGKKLHTGRSRNDQVATDTRLYVRDKCKILIDNIRGLQLSLLTKAKEYRETILPGYTHVQQAQPILAAHYLLSFFWALERDISRLQAVSQRSDEMPLGSGALAGSAFPYPRKQVAKLLGFSSISKNSIDATAQRDFALEYLNALCCIGSLLSRYAEDFVIWNSAEYGFIRLGDEFTSGSSMMPQKRNPDSMELIRGKSARLLGNYSRLFTLIKGTPMCYSRDLQEDKEPIFDSTETVNICLEVMSNCISGLVFNESNILNRMQPAMLATDLADYLVHHGLAFRDAHHLVGALIAKAEAKGCSFLELPADDWTKIPHAESFRKKLSYRYSIERRNIEGGTGSKSVARQMKEAEAILKTV